ncbi:MAG TPA: GNAT family N-acetyltransferase [Micromonosporaceae bacterium]|nr:GNAT family N-acetyltransferase [Micromonosporaceae bacterium]
MLTLSARPLGVSDRGAVERVLDADPIAAAQVAERVRVTGLSRRRTDGQVFGYGARRHLDAVCWLGGNVIPVGATGPAIDAFAAAVAARPRTCTSLIGSAVGVLGLWDRLAAAWGPAREVRAVQPLLVAHAPPPVVPDPRVRLVRPDEIDVLYPASVAMYTEEVGVSPLLDDGGSGYRARVAELVRTRRAYARIAGGRVVFKAELAIVTRHTAQVQGVWVAPELRGRGLAAAGVAAVVSDALHRVAPSVSLYVNDFNVAARRVYARCGFRRVGTFATVLF